MSNTLADGLSSIAKEIGLDVSAENVLSETELTTVNTIRSVYPDVLDQYSDEAVLAAHSYWKMSDDKNNKDTFPEWVETAAKEINAANERKAEAEAQAQYEAAMTVTNDEEAFSVPDDDALDTEKLTNYLIQEGDAVETEPTLDAELDEATMADFIADDSKAEIQVISSNQSGLIGTPPAPDNILDDLTPRQLLGLATDQLRKRRTDELTTIIGTLLSGIYGLQVSTESDVLVSIAENAKLVDFLISQYRLLGINPSITRITSSMQVESGRLEFTNRRGSRFTLGEIELGHVAAFAEIKTLLESKAKLAVLTATNDKLKGDITSLTQKLERQTKMTQEAEQRLDASRLVPKATPLLDSNGNGEVYVRWYITVKKNEKEQQISFYLTVEEGATPNDKGVYKTALIRRTKLREQALRFPSEEAARAMVERIIKNGKNLDVSSKVSVAKLQSAKIVRMMEIES